MTAVLFSVLMTVQGPQTAARARADDVRSGALFRHGRLQTHFEAGLREIFRIDLLTNRVSKKDKPAGALQLDLEPTLVVVCQTVCHRSAVGGIKWEKAGSGGNQRQIAALRGGSWKSSLTAGLS